jgi:hypothetical protein
MVEYCSVESAVLVYTKDKFSCFSDHNFQSYRPLCRKCIEKSKTRFVDFT